MALSRTLIGGLFFGVSFASWVIFLAGVGRSQAACVDGYNGGSKAVETCGNELGLDWWVVFFQLLNTIVATFLAAGSPSIARFKHTSLVFATMCTTLLMSVAHDACLTAYNLGEANKTGATLDGARVKAAGSVMCCILNMIWFICCTEESGQWAFRFFEAASEGKSGEASQSKSPSLAKGQEGMEVAIFAGSAASPTTRTPPPPPLPARHTGSSV